MDDDKYNHIIELYNKFRELTGVVVPIGDICNEDDFEVFAQNNVNLLIDGLDNIIKEGGYIDWHNVFYELKGLLDVFYKVNDYFGVIGMASALSALQLVAKKYNAGQDDLKLINSGIKEAQHYIERITRIMSIARQRIIYRLDYSDYLKTPDWQKKRQRALKRAGYKCQLCGNHTKSLEVHHNTYVRYGDELDTDLTVLCNDCHAKHHDKIPKSKI